MFPSLTRRVRRAGVAIVLVAAAPAALVTFAAGPAAAIDVGTEAAFRAAFANPAETTINLTANIDLTGPPACGTASPADRPAGAVALVINGNGFRIRQTCPETNQLFTSATTSLTINNAILDGGNNAVNGAGGGHSLTLNGTDITGVTSSSGSATAIFNLGAVTLSSSTITGTTSDTNDGNALAATGSVNLTDSTISETNGGNGATGIGAFGGAATSTTLTNSSIINTVATDGNATGLSSTGSGAVNLTLSQIVGTDSTGNTSGIFTSTGTTTLTDSSVLDTDGDTTNGITVTGDLVMNRSTIARTTGVVDTAAIVALDGEMLLVNSTLSNNDGAIATFSGDVTLVYSDVVTNGNVGGPDPTQMSVSGDLNTFGSIIALPTGAGVANCAVSGATNSSGYNFSDDDSCDLSGTGDTENGGDPGLAALATNGGPTENRMPLAGSPLIDAIPPADCGDGNGLAGFAVTVDQRSVARPQFAGCDVGSVEVAPEPPGPPGPPGPGPGPARPAGPADAVTAAPRFTG
jgi:hypothetical protein